MADKQSATVDSLPPPPFTDDVVARIAKMLAEQLIAVLPSQAVNARVPLFTTEPWKFFNMSHPTWNRLKDKPLPVDLPGTRKQWRVADLQAFAARLKPIRRRKARSTFGPLPATPGIANGNA
jgi:hypothetical protein